MLPQLLVLLAAIGGTALVLGAGVWLWSRTERLEGRGPPADAGERRQLEGELADVKEQLAATRDDTRRLSERVDFLERLLEGRDDAGDGDRRLGGGDAPG